MDGAYATRQNQEVKLKRKVPVHVTYLTAWAEKSGETRYFGDIYGHDKRIAIALNYQSGDPYRIDPVEAASRAVAKRQKIRNKNRGYYGYGGYGGGGYNSPVDSIFGSIFGWN